MQSYRLPFSYATTIFGNHLADDAIQLEQRRIYQHRRCLVKPQNTLQKLHVIRTVD